MKCFSTAQFSYSKICRVFVAKASSLQMNSTPAIIELESHVTGAKIKLEFDSVERDLDGDVTMWVYSNDQFQVRILND